MPRKPKSKRELAEDIRWAHVLDLDQKNREAFSAKWLQQKHREWKAKRQASKSPAASETTPESSQARAA
jgi:hypothetical protein